MGERDWVQFQYNKEQWGFIAKEQSVGISRLKITERKEE